MRPTGETPRSSSWAGLRPCVSLIRVGGKRAMGNAGKATARRQRPIGPTDASLRPTPVRPVCAICTIAFALPPPSPRAIASATERNAGRAWC